MPRKSTSSSTPGDDGAGAGAGAEQSQISQIQSQSPSDIVHLPESTGQMVEATEQQLKARAEGGVSIEDYLLPRSLTLRLAKSVLPPNTSIQKDAVLAIQKAATVFVSYLSSHANEATLKRTVAPSDVFSAISELEFDGFRTRLEQELEAFTELKAGKRRAKKGDSSSTTTAAAAEGVGKGGDAEEEEEDGDRGVKRVKRAEEKKNGIGGGEEEEGDETQEEHEQEQEQDDEEEEEEEEEEEDEEEEEQKDDDEEEEENENDIDRVEDLDRAKRPMNPDVEGDESDSEDEDGPGSQLRGDLGLG
ncbi:histone-fold-containing protein [Aspergillus eucalypticola CBS 122712]|uniref:DNA polymerase epsilon subunit D n=1 Tax=Aspergillus eucalypticola (strain CBS 122712 / IBT 29274) TaxID=1448314 RepID=A0A317WBK0_ASPEC|nr:histone-fold-containing protein [Aspergillus eucalypticola CBS 122712]PWY81500.1 histone-fold-containing protein [Aspergillus eucalypticola CBS 122712]